MASPEPPVAFKNHCSVIHDDTLYVYSPDAFQSLPLKKNATWNQEENGISVTGAVCVKGGIDGDSANTALYIVGGATNGSTSNYSGLQRYSFQDRKWQTITPMSAITANRVNHGATYLNASSAILIYSGSQNGNAGLSTETFLMLMYPPYRVQAYASTAPAVTKPFVLPWTEDKAVMIGGSATNQKVFTFHPDPGWVDLGVTLPNALPDPSIAQCNIQTLGDGSKILQTYYVNQSPNLVTRNVLLNPGMVPAPYGQTIGDSQGSGSTRMRRRQLFQQNYPIYNSTNAPSEQRSNFALATSDGVVAIVGGDTNSSVAVFNSSGNSWVDNKALFGSTQNILTASVTSTSSSLPTSTSTPTLAATSSAVSSPAAAAGDNGQSNGLAILGGVLGGICGLAAILIISLLWLRSVKRRRAAEAAKNSNGELPYPNDKPRGGHAFEEAGSQPLSQQAQPMGRSPVPSTVVSEQDSLAMFGGKNNNEKSADPQAQVQSYGGSKLNPAHGTSNSMGGIFKSNKNTLNISKPMLPDSADYQERPSADLDKAIPAGPPALPPVALVSQQKADQRKTDEGWAKYFSADTVKDNERSSHPNNRDTYATDRTSTSRPSTGKGGGGGFWPGSGVPSSSNRSTKLPMRDSAGNVLNQYTVATASPSLETAPNHAFAHNASVVAPAKAKFSSADSISTDHSSDEEYEDDEMDAYSDYRGSKHDHNAWTPVGNTWSGPGQRPLRPPSDKVGPLDFPPPTSISEQTSNTSTSGASSIPTFPLPDATLRRAGPESDQQFTGTTTVHHPAATHFATTVGHNRKSSNTFNGGPPVQDYFGPPPDTASSRPTSGKLPDSTDMSWLNLGTPAHTHGSPHSGNSHDPA